MEGAGSRIKHTWPNNFINISQTVFYVPINNPFFLDSHL